jgi:hypothetical protein
MYHVQPYSDIEQVLSAADRAELRCLQMEVQQKIINREHKRMVWDYRWDRVKLWLRVAGDVVLACAIVGLLYAICWLVMSL